MIIASILTASLLVPLPQPPPVNPVPPAVNWFAPPSGPLPWEVPVFPPVSFDIEVPSTTFLDVEHTDGYAGVLADVEAQFDSVNEPIETANGWVIGWLGGDELPDMTADDTFSTGFDPCTAGLIYACDFKLDVTDFINDTWEFIRLLRTIDIGNLPWIVCFILMCAAWMLFITFVKFGFQVTDFVVSMVLALWEAIPFI